MATNPSTLAENNGRHTTPSVAYPFGSAKDDSTGTTGDGTPIREALLNDNYGLQQAIMRAAGLTPSGDADTAIASQYMQGIVQQAMGRAELYDDTGAADAYVLENRANQQGPGGVFEGMRVTFTPDNTSTGAATADISSLLDQAPGTTVVDIKLAGGSGDPAAAALTAGAEATVVYRTAPSAHLELQGVESGTYPRGYIFQLSPFIVTGTDADHDVTTATGRCRDASDVINIDVNSAVVKQIDGVWVEGTNQPGRFPGVALTANTTYFFHVIVKDSDGTVDAGFDTSETAANRPVGWGRYRALLPFLTNSSANLMQYGRTEQGTAVRVEYKAPVESLSTTAPGTSQQSLTLAVPQGVRLLARVLVKLRDEATSSVTVRETTSDNIAPTLTNATVSVLTNSNTASVVMDLATDDSGRINYRSDRASGLSAFTIQTLGFTYERG